MLYPHPARIEIDLEQFKRNISLIRRHIGPRLFCLPIKANAYGHGLCPMARAAVEAGIDSLAVSCLQEAHSLREANVDIPILVFGAIHEEQIADLIDLDLEIAVASRFKADLLAQKCRELGKTCRIHLKVDTGLQRTGVRPATALEVIEYIKSHPSLQIKGIYSHLASAEDPKDPIALKQIETFLSLVEHPAIRDLSLIRHIANTGGVAYFPKSHLDMVRPGLLAYGYVPKNAPEPLKEIAPCFSLKAKVSYFKVVPKGEGISYGHSHTTEKQTRIVTVPVGYGDGYRRSLSNRASVLIRGKKFPVVGNICMDQFMVDIGDEESYVGDEVVLIGKQGSQEISLQEIARFSDTIPHEVLTLFNERIPRFYKA